MRNVLPLVHILHVSRMMVQYLVAQSGYVYVCVYLCSLDILVSQHLLNGTQIGTALEQGSGKGVSQGVWRHCLCYACLLGSALYHDENHGAREVGTTSVEENIFLLAWLHLHKVTVEEP